MGIPRFYKFITEQFPSVSDQTSFRQGFTEKVDNLYLDANGIIHNCAREVYFKKPTNPRLARPSKDCAKPTSDQLEKLLFQEITNYMDQLLKFVKPKKLFYIAIDGPAPLAKQAQQRQRRYKAAEEKTIEELSIFDSTAITPGTQFMHKLGSYIGFYIRKMITSDPVWKNITIVFSGANVAGEGEHKIVQYIREQPDRKELVHCMYGLDADLFMLSLSTHCQKFYLLREDQFNTIWNDTLFYKVDIGLLRKEFIDYWGSIGCVEERLIDDFIFVCFMVGNDFLHALPCCHDLIDSINFIMELRKSVLSSSYITNSGTLINLNNLAILLTHLATTETQTIAAQYYHQNFPNITINSSLIDPMYPNKGINPAKYKELYYRKAGIDHKDQHAVWNYCKQYLQGLEWVYYYYHAEPKNWQWFFPYHYSPLVADIVDYLTNASNGSRLTRVSNKILGPILPFQQLLCVVPPRSKKLLPRYLRSVYEKQSLSQYYPTKYVIDLEGKTREWEGIALLPFIDLDCIVNAYTKATTVANEKNITTIFARNTLGRAIQYSFSNETKYTYKSKYGKIINCCVDTLQL